MMETMFMRTWARNSESRGLGVIFPEALVTNGWDPHVSDRKRNKKGAFFSTAPAGFELGSPTRGWDGCASHWAGAVFVTDSELYTLRKGCGMPDLMKNRKMCDFALGKIRTGEAWLGARGHNRWAELVFMFNHALGGR